MRIFTAFIFICSVASFLAMFQYFIRMQRPGIYPSKKALKQKVGTFAASGAALLVLGMILSLF